MKNLTRKLFLSICTLAVCAVTLVSTTFAWYTTNTEATTNAVNASSTNATRDGSILISATGEADTWSSVCTPVTNNMVSMVPLQLLGDSLAPYGSTAGTDGVHADNSGSYLYFKVYFKTTKNTATAVGNTIPVYLKDITLANKATSADGLTAQDNLLWNNSTAPAKAPNQSTYRVDIVRALNLFTVANDDTTNPTKTHLDLTNLNDRNVELEKVKVGDSWQESISDTGESAHEYYNTVMGSTKTLVEPTDLEKGDVLSTSATDASIILGYLKCTAINDGVATYSQLEVTFKVYLDGWDLYCFDACKGQTFSVSLAFTTEESDVAIRTTTSA